MTDYSYLLSQFNVLTNRLNTYAKYNNLNQIVLTLVF